MDLLEIAKREVLGEESLEENSLVTLTPDGMIVHE